MNESQRGMVGARIKPLFEEEARQRQFASLKQNTTTVEANLPERKKRRSRDDAAKITGTNRHYISDAKKIQKKAPKLIEGVIDGRNRYKACVELGVEPEYREWNGEGSLVSFVVSLNLHRRHLTSSQKTIVGLEILPWLEGEAKERQKIHCGTAPGKTKTLTQKIGEVKHAGEATEQAAKITGTNRQ